MTLLYGAILLLGLNLLAVGLWYFVLRKTILHKYLFLYLLNVHILLFLNIDFSTFTFYIDFFEPATRLISILIIGSAYALFIPLMVYILFLFYVSKVIYKKFNLRKC